MSILWEQTSKKKFDRAIRNYNAKCFSELGVNKYAYYSDEHGRTVAKIDQELDIYELNVSIKKESTNV